MRNTEEIIEGKIVSAQLAEFANTGIIYGYISIDAILGNTVAVKIDSYTHHESLEIGDYVVVRAASLGKTDILVATDVTRKDSVEHTAGEVTMATP
jgi:acyl-CoA hydrolase